jgi:uncharacterized protein
MVQVSYPGVYIQEVPSSVRTIKSVSTSVTAFIDFFREGPLNRAVQIFGMTDFDRVFGGLDRRSPASYAIAQFFLNGGSEAYVVRVNRDNPAGTPTAPLATAAVDLSSAVSAGVQVLRVSAANPGVWGNNLRVDVDHLTSAPTSLFNMTVTRYDRPGGAARPLATEKHVNLSMDVNHPRYVLRAVNEASSFAQLTHLTAGTGNALLMPTANGMVGGNIGSLTAAQLDALSNRRFRISFGSGAVLQAQLDTWAAGTVTNLNQLRGRVESAIRRAGTAGSQPALAGARVELQGGNRLVVYAGRGGGTYDPVDTLNVQNAVDPADNAATALLQLAGAGVASNVQQYPVGLPPVAPLDIAALHKVAAGADGDVPGPAELIGSEAVDPHTGLFALDYVDLFNILCIPRAAEFSDTEMTAVVSNAIAYCEAKRSFLIVDIPENVDEVQEMKDWLEAHAGFRHRNAAVYFPRVRVPDPLEEYRLKSVAASGTLAGLYARTDAQRGVWKAPAGIEATLAGVSELATRLTDPQNGTLNPLGINCLRTFPIYGSIAWGTRTLLGADQIGSEWAYIPVRRLALMLEESLFRGTKWVVFEPNDEPLWAKIRLNVGAYMTSLFRQGAFQGATPKEAFFVKCDAETTTQNDRNQGIVNIEVGFAPLKPAEFVVIKIQQMPGDL